MLRKNKTKTNKTGMYVMLASEREKSWDLEIIPGCEFILGCMKFC